MHSTSFFTPKFVWISSVVMDSQHCIQSTRFRSLKYPQIKFLGFFSWCFLQVQRQWGVFVATQSIFTCIARLTVKRPSILGQEDASQVPGTVEGKKFTSVTCATTRVVSSATWEGTSGFTRGKGHSSAACALPHSTSDRTWKPTCARTRGTSRSCVRTAQTPFREELSWRNTSKGTTHNLQCAKRAHCPLCSLGKVTLN